MTDLNEGWDLMMRKAADSAENEKKGHT